MNDSASPEPNSTPNYGSAHGWPFYERLNPFGRTVVEAFLVASGNMCLVLILHGAHLQMLLAGKANVKNLELLRTLNPALLLVLAILIAPVLEESFFRGLPYLIARYFSRLEVLNRSSNEFMYWAIGGLAAVLFALAHADGGGSFHLPVPQLIFGLWSWRVINLRGLRYSILLHAVHNLLLSTLMLQG